MKGISYIGLGQILALTIVLFLSGCSYKGFIKKSAKEYSKGNNKDAQSYIEKAIDKNPLRLEAYVSMAKQGYGSKFELDKSLDKIDQALLIKETRTNRENRQELKNYQFEIVAWKLEEILKLESSEQSIEKLLDLKSRLKTINLSEVTIGDGFDYEPFLNNIEYLKILLVGKFIAQGDFLVAQSLLTEVLISNQLHNHFDYNQGYQKELLESLISISIKLGRTEEGIFFISQLADMGSSPKLKSLSEDLYSKIHELTIKNKEYQKAIKAADILFDLDNEKYRKIREETYLEYGLVRLRGAISIDSDQKKLQYENVIHLMNTISEDASQPMKINNLKGDVYFKLAKLNIKQGNHIDALNYLNFIRENHKSFMPTNKYLSVRRDLFIQISDSLVKHEKFVDALDFLHQILIEIPEDPKLNQLKDKIKLLQAEASYQQGMILLKEKDYELAEYYLKKSLSSHDSFAFKAWHSLHRLYEKVFLIDESIEALDMASLTAKKKSIGYDNALTHYKRAAFLATRNNEGDESKAIELLLSLYCNHEYERYKYEAGNDPRFQNLASNEAFKRFVNGVRRIQISNISATDLSCTDQRYLSLTKEVDPFLQVFEEDKLLEHFGNRAFLLQAIRNPVWNTPIVFDYKIGSNITFEIWDDDLPWDWEFCNEFKTDNLCETQYLDSEQGIGRLYFKASTTSKSPNVNKVEKVYSPIYSESSFVRGVQAVICLFQTFLRAEFFAFLKFIEWGISEQGINENSSTEILQGTMVSYTKDHYLSPNLKRAMNGLFSVGCLRDFVKSYSVTRNW